MVLGATFETLAGLAGGVASACATQGHGGGKKRGHTREDDDHGLCRGVWSHGGRRCGEHQLEGCAGLIEDGVLLGDVSLAPREGGRTEEEK